MLNYLKFATYQIFGFSCSIPKLNKIKKNQITLLIKKYMIFYINKLKSL